MLISFFLGFIMICQHKKEITYMLSIFKSDMHSFLMMYINPFMPNVFFSHPYQLYEFISNFWVVGLCFFYSYFKRHFCKKTVENLIRRRVLRRLISFCTVCQCPTKSKLGLNGLSG